LCTPKQELQARIDDIDAARPAQQADIEERIAALVQLADPQRLADAMDDLSKDIAASGTAAEAVSQQNDGQVSVGMLNGLLISTLTSCAWRRVQRWCHHAGVHMSNMLQER